MLHNSLDVYKRQTEKCPFEGGCPKLSAYYLLIVYGKICKGKLCLSFRTKVCFNKKQQMEWNGEGRDCGMLKIAVALLRRDAAADHPGDPFRRAAVVRHEHGRRGHLLLRHRHNLQHPALDVYKRQVLRITFGA